VARWAHADYARRTGAERGFATAKDPPPTTSAAAGAASHDRGGARDVRVNAASRRGQRVWPDIGQAEEFRLQLFPNRLIPEKIIGNSGSIN